MKKNKKLYFSVILCVIVTHNIYAQGAVSVPILETIQTSSLIQQFTGYLTAIDTLYSNFDMVMNTITQIENQYKSIQQAIERAKSIDWENITFDGDFDIRNDIRDANKRVNKLLTEARNIKSALTTNVIKLPGGVGYSIADLCGMGEDGTKDLFKAADDVFGYMTENMKSAMDAAVNGISYEQGSAIWSKYGISPGNYWYVVQTENQMKTAATNAISWALDATGNLMVEQEEAEKRSVIFKAAEASLDSEGNMTEGATSEATMRLLGLLSEQCSGLRTALREATGLQANKIMQELAEKEAKASSDEEQKKLSEYVHNDMPGYFVTNAEASY